MKKGNPIRRAPKSSARSRETQAAIREARSHIAILKAKGVVPKKVDARSVKITKYRKSQIRKNFDIITGVASPLIPKNKEERRVIKEYAEKGVFEKRGRYLVIPQEYKKNKQAIRKGRIEITGNDVKGNWIKFVVMPMDKMDIREYAEMIEQDPDYPDWLTGTEQYALSIFGHKSAIGFKTKQDLVNHILRNYKHLFGKEAGNIQVNQFSLSIYSSGSLTPPDAVATGDKSYSVIGEGRNPKKPADPYIQRKRAMVRAAKSELYRSKMTEQEREAYKEAARQRARKSYKKGK